MNTTDLKPSHFTSFPRESILRKWEAETIARNIMVIKKRLSDSWELLTWEVYRAERLKDKGFSEIEKSCFEEIQPLIATPELALQFSPDWLTAALEVTP